MKIGFAAALLVLVATPALSAATKTVGKVTFECLVTGSDKDGFDLNAINGGDSVMDCTAACQLTQGDSKKTKEFSYTKTVRKVGGRQAFYGEAGLPGKPLTNPNVTKATCTEKK